ncbi:MAG TPA: tRNA (adenosine(37)-N6)-threonylcarbamoyltransferase complex dimerization subunit type 1 TsaB, partial [Chitinophagaceae bacterium]|nr:tRNA (adenosine(37)-N6)-threonylcarbamoyltransferase complex dimerization subunit type 1 TsaB [Chitinophagaceae bacterium]
MALILNIDTAVELASVCLSNDDKVISLTINKTKNDHAAWLHPAIHKLIQDEELRIEHIEAAAVSIGPGSYTGLRLGLSAAKGICYALNIPLITINTLQMMAHSVSAEAHDLICPLIDARRMEVFMAVYTKSYHEIVRPASMIVDKNSFTDILSSHHITFCGNGVKKIQSLLSHANALTLE